MVAGGDGVAELKVRIVYTDPVAPAGFLNFPDNRREMIGSEASTAHYCAAGNLWSVLQGMNEAPEDIKLTMTSDQSDYGGPVVAHFEGTEAAIAEARALVSNGHAVRVFVFPEEERHLRNYRTENCPDMFTAECTAHVE